MAEEGILPVLPYREGEDAGPHLQRTPSPPERGGAATFPCKCETLLTKEKEKSRSQSASARKKNAGNSTRTCFPARTKFPKKSPIGKNTLRRPQPNHPGYSQRKKGERRPCSARGGRKEDPASHHQKEVPLAAYSSYFERPSIGEWGGRAVHADKESPRMIWNGGGLK